VPFRRRKSAELELVESALSAVVKFEEAAARYVAIAFQVKQTSIRYQQTLAMYRVASAERLAAQRSLHQAVRDYAVIRRRDGVTCEAAVSELTKIANRITRSELTRAERRQLTTDIARWTVRAYVA
jgi:hypothetical protein